MAFIISIASGMAGYLVGSIPFGWVIVKLLKGVDIRTFGSGRTGGTNVARLAGWPAGFAAALLDLSKGIVMVLLTRAIGQAIPNTHGWPEALAGIGVVLGHNASLYLGFRGGAGGATAVGTSMALSPIGGLPSLALGVIFWLGVGYASLGSMMAGFGAAVALTIAAVMGQLPASYAVYGWGMFALILIALRPNIQRLREGTERRVSLFDRARKPSA